MTQFSEPYVSPHRHHHFHRFRRSRSPSSLFWRRITTILISRFLLDLQSAKRKACSPQGTITLASDEGLGALVFERVIGSLGSSIGIHSGIGECGFKDSDSFDEGGRTSMDLTIQVGGLSTKGEKSDGPDSGVDPDGGMGMRVEMTPLSASEAESPRSALGPK